MAFGLTARYEENSTLSTVVQETGVVASDGTQKMYLVGGNWSTALSERSTLVNETDYTHVTYDIDTLTDYDELATRFSWNYAWSEQVELFTRLSVRRYEPEEGSAVASSNSYTPTVGLNVQLSERLKGTAYAGLNQISGTDSGPKGQGGLMLQYAGERIDTSIDASRSTLASGDGGFVEVDALRGTWSYAVDETRRPVSMPPGKTPKARHLIPCKITVPGLAKNSRLFGLHAYPTHTNNASKMACRMPLQTSSG